MAEIKSKEHFYINKVRFLYRMLYMYLFFCLTCIKSALNYH